MPKTPQSSIASALDLFRVDREALLDRNETRRVVTSGARLSISYLLMNAAATLIAGYGLLANSEAVVIGAMLIAMLYDPILGIGLALAELDVRTLATALAAEIVGMLWVLTIGAGIGWLHDNVPISEQLLARTTPNLLDMMIALVGGAAGAYAAAAKRISGAVVGVAIATALCPPLTACGIPIARGYPQLASGAFILFLTNLTAISAAAMAVFLVMGHRAQPTRNSFSATVQGQRDWFGRNVEDVSNFRLLCPRRRDLSDAPIFRVRQTGDAAHAMCPQIFGALRRGICRVRH